MQEWNWCSDTDTFTTQQTLISAPFYLFCLQYSVEVHPLFAVPAVNDVVGREYIGFTLSFFLFSLGCASFSKATCTYSNPVVDERRGKKTSQQVLFMDSLRLFFFPSDQAQLWALRPPVNLFHTLEHDDIHQALLWGGGVCLLWGCKLPCAVVWSDLSSPSVTYH